MEHQQTGNTFFIKKLILLCTAIVALSSISFQWPVTNARITSTFGESRWDHFHDGIDIISSAMKIQPLASGKVVFVWDKSLFPLDNYPGGGNYKVIQHNNAFYSIYMHLEENPIIKRAYSKNDVLGYIGNTGHSFGKHLHLGVLKIGEGKSVNPFTLLPKREDTKNPVVVEYAVRIGERYFNVRDGSKLRFTHHYPLLVKIHDKIHGNERLGVYKLSYEFNGTLIRSVTFSNITFTKKELTIQGMPFDDLYDRKGYYKLKGITYNDGMNFLKIKAVDFAGNVTTEEITFNINLDIK